MKSGRQAVPRESKNAGVGGNEAHYSGFSRRKRALLGWKVRRRESKRVVRRFRESREKIQPGPSRQRRGFGAKPRRVARLLKNGVFIKNFNQAPLLLKKGKIPVSGGMMPGITTDSVSVLFAEMLGARLVVNVSKAAGVYDSNPSKNPKAKKFARLSHDALVGLAMRFDSRKARENFVFDVVACKLAARSKISLSFVSSNPVELEKALEGRKFSGTIVS